MGSRANPPSSRAMTPPTSWTSPSAATPTLNPTAPSRKTWSNAWPSPRTASPASHRSRLLRPAPALQPDAEQLNKDGPADPLAFAYHFDCSEHQVLDRLSRYESRIQRDYSRCLKDLQALQAARKNEINQTNPKKIVTPVHPAPSGDSDTTEQ